MPAHLLFELLAYTLGFTYYRYLKKRNTDNVTSLTRIYLIIAAAFGALLGSRLLGILEHWQLWQQGQHTLLFLTANKTIVGALLGGLIAVEVTKKIVSIAQTTGDLFTFPLMLGMMIGRIGCLLNGLHDATVGVATTLPWGIDFGDGIYRHPTSLYEIIFLLLLWLVLAQLNYRHKLQSGVLFRLFLLSYLTYRFCIGFIQPHDSLVWQLSAIQWASLAGILCYARVLIFPQRYYWQVAGDTHGNTRLRLL